MLWDKKQKDVNIRMRWTFLYHSSEFEFERLFMFNSSIFEKMLFPLRLFAPAQFDSLQNLLARQPLNRFHQRLGALITFAMGLVANKQLMH